MKFGDVDILRAIGNVRLLKIGCRNDKIAYCVTGNGSTRYYEDYEDASDEFNLRWMREKYGE